MKDAVRAPRKHRPISARRGRQLPDLIRKIEAAALIYWAEIDPDNKARFFDSYRRSAIAAAAIAAAAIPLGER